jgi:hypothetical protein
VKYIVKFVHKQDGDCLYLGGPGLDVNAGVRVAHRSVVLQQNAHRFDKLSTAKRRSYDRNGNWRGEVMEVDE